jgi:hypothetical protein
MFHEYATTPNNFKTREIGRENALGYNAIVTTRPLSRTLLVQLGDHALLGFAPEEEPVALAFVPRSGGLVTVVPQKTQYTRMRIPKPAQLRPLIANRNRVRRCAKCKHREQFDRYRAAQMR